MNYIYTYILFVRRVHDELNYLEASVNDVFHDKLSDAFVSSGHHCDTTNHFVLI